MNEQLLADTEFHRRRAEMEMHLALMAGEAEAAVRHLQLAREHRQRRDSLVLAWRDTDLGDRPRITRTDKEG